MRDAINKCTSAKYNGTMTFLRRGEMNVSVTLNNLFFLYVTNMVMTSVI